MDTKDHPVIVVLGDQRQLVVPIFQRQYAWGENRLQAFWEDVVAKAEETAQGKPKFNHYMGALILAPGGDGFTIGATPIVQVIDGQQRLTTFQIFLAALREVAGRLEMPEVGNLVRGYLHMPKMEGDESTGPKHRLIPTPEDRAVFHLIIDEGVAGVRRVHSKSFFQNGKLIRGAAPVAVRAFWYFIEMIERHARFGLVTDEDDVGTDDIDDGHEAQKARLQSLLRAMLNHLKLVVITLSEDDDAQVIFETLNSKAEPLLAMDLVRNNIFHRAAASGEKVEELFDTKWRPFDRNAAFWKADSPRAKPKRPRIDHFLSHALTAQTGQETSLRELYSEYRAFTRPSGKPRFTTVEDELDALVSFADIYETLEVGGADADLAWIGRKLAIWEVSTAYPLIFCIAKSSASDEEKKSLYRLVYSYLVRRAICGLTPKSLNKTFARLTSAMLSHGVSIQTFADAFVDQKGPAVRFPDDAELEEAIRSKPVYHQFSRKERLADVLWDLEMVTRTKFSVATARPDNMSIEHVMPQTWTTYWPLADGRFVPADKQTGADQKMIEDARTRDALIHTLGNLTLITVPGNTAASNSAFIDKKPWLLTSLLALNLEVTTGNKWDHQAIDDRATAIATRAKSVWPALT